MRCYRRLGVVVLCVCGLGASVHAQAPNLEPGLSGEQPIPTISFQWESPAPSAASYSITLDSLGRAVYRSDEIGPSANETQTGVPYVRYFTVPDDIASRIFSLARQVGYFNGDFDDAGYPSEGEATKTLTYAEGPPDWFGNWTNGVHNATTYNYSVSTAIRQLTDIFESLASTLGA